MATNNAVNTTLSGQTGTANFVGSTSPTLVTPTLGAALATSINFGGSTLNNYTSITAWTPVFTFATPGNLSVVYTTQVGNYSRIGNIITANFQLSFTPTFTTATGNVTITGLPVTSNAASGNVSFGSCFVNCTSFPTATTCVVIDIAANASSFALLGFGSGIGVASFTITNFPTTVAAIIQGSIVYQA